MLTLKDLKKMQDIEAVAYPEFMQIIVNCKNIKELADYCECKTSQLYLLLEDNCYLLAAIKSKSVEVVDFASTDGCKNIFKVIHKCFNAFKGKKVYMDCRESTSYPIVHKILERKGIEYTCSSWDWNGETMYEISFQL